MAKFEIAPGRWVGGDHPCFVIAEIGQNHQGSLEIAKQMIKMAKDCGADCAKFQKCDLAEKFNKKALNRPYTSKHSWGPTYGEHKAFIEFTEEEFLQLKNYADEIGIIFSSSAGDVKSVNLVDRVGAQFIKVASPDAGNFTLVEYAASKGKPLVVSTGTQDMDTVRELYRRINKINPSFAILQCTSAYPMCPEDAHLNVIQSYKTEFPNAAIGYSGHETGTAISLAAVALGAKIIERHFTLDKAWKGNDHAASLEPAELKTLIQNIRIIEKALGTTQKRTRESERPFCRKLGKSLVAARKLDAGKIIVREDLNAKVAEPKGINVEKLPEIVGRKLKKSVEADESLFESDIE